MQSIQFQYRFLFCNYYNFVWIRDNSCCFCLHLLEQLSFIIDHTYFRLLGQFKKESLLLNLKCEHAICWSKKSRRTVFVEIKIRLPETTIAKLERSHHFLRPIFSSLSNYWHATSDWMKYLEQHVLRCSRWHFFREGRMLYVVICISTNEPIMEQIWINLFSSPEHIHFRGKFIARSKTNKAVFVWNF